MSGLLKDFDFGNEAGDDVDPAELTSYFVEQELFKKFLNPKEKVLLATAKKGVGKSALITWLAAKVAKNENTLVIKVRGADLVRTRFKIQGDPKNPNEFIQDWMVRICTVINRELATTFKIALSDDKITAIEAAELEGFKSRNLVGCLIDRFGKILGKASPTKIGSSDEIALLKRLKTANVWFLIDDLDATFQNSPAECMALSTFFSACRHIAADMNGVCFRTTMRTDVWAIIKRFDEALDKMDQYVTDISWQEDDFKKLLAKRVLAHLQAHNAKLPISKVGTVEDNLIGQIFTPKMPWGETEAETYKVVYTLSYRRPRWAIQLCKLAQKAAVGKNEDIISKNHINMVWGDYGVKRISDLVAEHKHQCTEIEELIVAFRKGSRQMRRDELFNWINLHIINHLTPIIEGKKVKSPLEVAQFLYRIGFIVARSQEPSGNYEHYGFDQMPDFLSSRSNDDFGVLWEIHPCFREALDIAKLNEHQRQKRGLIRHAKYRRKS